MEICIKTEDRRYHLGRIHAHREQLKWKHRQFIRLQIDDVLAKFLQHHRLFVFRNVHFTAGRYMNKEYRLEMNQKWILNSSNTHRNILAMLGRLVCGHFMARIIWTVDIRYSVPVSVTPFAIIFGFSFSILITSGNRSFHLMANSQKINWLILSTGKTVAQNKWNTYLPCTLWIAGAKWLNAILRQFNQLCAAQFRQFNEQSGDQFKALFWRYLCFIDLIQNGNNHGKSFCCGRLWITLEAAEQKIPKNCRIGPSNSLDGRFH